MLLLKTAAACLYMVWVVACIFALADLPFTDIPSEGIAVLAFLITVFGPAALVAGVVWLIERVSRAAAARLNRHLYEERLSLVLVQPHHPEPERALVAGRTAVNAEPAAPVGAGAVDSQAWTGIVGPGQRGRRRGRSRSTPRRSTLNALAKGLMRAKTARLKRLEALRFKRLTAREAPPAGAPS